MSYKKKKKLGNFYIQNVSVHVTSIIPGHSALRVCKYLFPIALIYRIWQKSHVRNVTKVVWV